MDHHHLHPVGQQEGVQCGPLQEGGGPYKHNIKFYQTKLLNLLIWVSSKVFHHILPSWVQGGQGEGVGGGPLQVGGGPLESGQIE